MNLAISADIIAFTSLLEKDKRTLENSINQLLSEFSKKYQKEDFYGRLVQGDHIECAMTDAKYGLRIALLLKTFIKSISAEFNPSDDKRFKYFTMHGLRAAIAAAPLTTLNSQRGTIDGDAIYLAGRALTPFSTYNKEKIIIRQTLFFLSDQNDLQERIEPLILLIDSILAKISAKQAEVLFYKLDGMGENDIAIKLGKQQSTINQHSNAAGWYAIDKALNYFEKWVNR